MCPLTWEGVDAGTSGNAAHESQAEGHSGDRCRRAPHPGPDQGAAPTYTCLDCCSILSTALPLACTSLVGSHLPGLVRKPFPTSPCIDIVLGTQLACLNFCCERPQAAKMCTLSRSMTDTTMHEGTQHQRPFSSAAY